MENNTKFFISKDSIPLVSTLWKFNNSYKTIFQLFSVLFCGFLIYLHWEAMIITYLSTKVIVLPFKDLHSLYHSSNYKLAVEVGTSSADFFKVTRSMGIILGISFEQLVVFFLAKQWYINSKYLVEKDITKLWFLHYTWNHNNTKSHD